MKKLIPVLVILFVAVIYSCTSSFSNKDEVSKSLTYDAQKLRGKLDEIGKSLNESKAELGIHADEIKKNQQFHFISPEATAREINICKEKIEALEKVISKYEQSITDINIKLEELETKINNL